MRSLRFGIVSAYDYRGKCWNGGNGPQPDLTDANHGPWCILWVTHFAINAVTLRRLHELLTQLLRQCSMHVWMSGDERLENSETFTGQRLGLLPAAHAN